MKYGCWFWKKFIVFDGEYRNELCNLFFVCKLINIWEIGYVESKGKIDCLNNKENKY